MSGDVIGQIALAMLLCGGWLAAILGAMATLKLYQYDRPEWRPMAINTAWVIVSMATFTAVWRIL